MAVNLLPGWAWYPSRTQAAESRGPKQAAPAQLQRVVLHIRRPGQMAGDQKMDYVRGAPFHPQIQGKSERWHQTMKNRVLLENYYLPGDLERQIGAFVDYYNNQRYHESLSNVTPADVYYGRDKAIIREREKIKKMTIQSRRLQHQKQAA